MRETGHLFRSEGDRIGQIRLRGALPLVVAGGILSGLLMLRLTRRFDFYYDEWSYVLDVRNWSLGRYFVPHNEHWATIPAVTYRVLLLVFGARSYQPYMIVLAIWNLLTAVFLFLLIRRRSGDVLGLIAAAMLLTLGQGWENLIWADQIGFVGSTALGLLAILLLTGREVQAVRAWAGSAALMAALMTQGPALFFVCWLIVELALDKGARRRLLYLVPPIVAYLVWFVIIGRTTITSHESPLALATLQALLPYVGTGIGASASALAGFNSTTAPIGGLAIAAIVTVVWARRRPTWTVVGAAAGLVAEFVILGLVRSRYGDVDAGYPRYVDIAAIFLLVILADAASRIPWRSPWGAGLLAAVLIAILLNGLTLHQASKARYLDSILPGQVSQQVAWAYRGDPGLDRGASVDPAEMPYFSVRSYLEARGVQGSPLPDVTPSQLGRYPGALVDRAMVHLLPPHWNVAPAAADASCSLESTGGVVVSSGTSVTLRSDQTGQVAVLIWHYGPTPTTPAALVTLRSARDVLTVRPGEAQPGFTWHVLVVGAPYSRLSVCERP